MQRLCTERFTTTTNVCTDISNLIIDGDWNVTPHSLDRRGGVPLKSSIYGKKLISVMEELELIDIFLKQFPQKLSSSYESQAQNVCSMIYLFLVTGSFSQCVVNIHAKASNATDHKAIKFSLELLGEKRGPGLWKFNNALVDHEEYVNRIKENYSITGEKYQDLDDHRLKWELIKMEIRRLIIAYPKNKAKRQRKRESDVQTRLEV